MLKHVIFISVAVIIVFAFILIDNYSARPDNLPAFLLQIRTGDFTLGIESLAFTQALIALILILVFLVLFFIIKSIGGRIILILALSLIDLGITTRMLSPYSVYAPELKVKDMNEFADAHFVKSYPVPDMHTDVIHHSDSSSVRGAGLWRNLNNYYGQFAHGGFSSYINKNIDLMEDSLINIYRAALHHKPLYVSKCVRLYNEMNPLDSVHLCDYANNIPYGFTSAGEIEIVSYTPNRVEFKVNTPESAMICYLQSWHKYWTATVNGQKREIYLVNNFHMGVTTDCGENTIVFEFKPRHFSWSLITSLSVFFLGLVFMIYFRIRNI